MQIRSTTCKCGSTIVFFSLTTYIQSQLLLLFNLKPGKMLHEHDFL